MLRFFENLKIVEAHVRKQDSGGDYEEFVQFKIWCDNNIKKYYYDTDITFDRRVYVFYIETLDDWVMAKVRWL